MLSHGSLHEKDLHPSSDAAVGVCVPTADGHLCGRVDPAAVTAECTVLPVSRGRSHLLLAKARAVTSNEYGRTFLWSAGTMLAVVVLCLLV